MARGNFAAWTYFTSKLSEIFRASGDERTRTFFFLLLLLLLLSPLLHRETGAEGRKGEKVRVIAMAEVVPFLFLREI